MTSRELTGLRALPDRVPGTGGDTARSDLAYRIAFGAIGWPWLLYSLWGGTRPSKARLLARIGLPADALPHLGSWKADTGFLHRIVDAVEQLRPRHVVELGAGASTLVCGRALQLNGGGRLTSYDQHAEFVSATAGWLAAHGVNAELRHAPLTRTVPGWPGRWYAADGLPETIDLLIIDGPPWAIHPYVRGAAECLFDRLAPGGLILLDDAARPGERIVARRWRRRHPDIAFERVGGSTKGTLIGRKRRGAGQVIPFPERRQRPAAARSWRRAAGMLALLGTGWLAHDAFGTLTQPVQAASFLDEANASYATSAARQRMRSQLESTRLDRAEIGSTTGIALPDLPRGWRVADVQIYPARAGMAVALALRTDGGETAWLFAKKAETAAEDVPLLAELPGRSVAYWERGPFAYALTAASRPARVMALAAMMAADRS